MRARLQPIPVSARDPGGYDALVSGEMIERARELGSSLVGARVLYASAAPPEAADASASLAPLLRGLGIEADRAILHGDCEFAMVAGDAGDALRGSEWALAEGEWQALREACEAAAVNLDLRSYDAVVVQGAGSAALIEGRLSGGDWLWRTGADASGAAEEALAAFGPLLEDYRSLSFALPGFALPGAPDERLRIVAGAFDPLGERPVARGPWPAGLDPARPLLCHVGRLDAWADPIAAVEAWELAREEAPGLQLAVAGRVAPADPEAIGVLEEVRAFAAEEEDLHLVTDRGGAGAERIAAVATLARCAMRCTVGGEFDPVVSESQWRGTPVIGEGPTIAAQVAEGEGGFVAEGAAAQAERIAALATDARLALEVALAGRDRVLERFSMPRLLAEEVETLDRLFGTDRGRDADAPAPRPPGRAGARA